ncbi:MAG TPA: 1-acyl-sn-glycerol-3-phosphate acyltransferase [Cellvibrionaceae bacterium]
MSEFDDIRPYNDDEVKPTLQRLLNDTEFLDTIASLKLPGWLKSLRPLFRPLVKKRLCREVSDISSVFAFQQRIEYYMGQMLEKTITHLTISGLDQLNKNSAYCFISNHRDISMDPAFVNWALFHGGYQTLRIAIGDNLLTKPFASDLMRLNKSFIVNRSATAPREKFKVAKKLSHYIQFSMHEERSNIWIAQREGRAKDGIDKTNPAIISMLALHKEKAQAFSDYIADTHIVPVSISYEYDPCDLSKARELTLKAEEGKYLKGEQEDVQSIALGITGFKGAVHLAFGEPIGAGFETVEQVTEALDNAIINNYVLHPSNCIAYEHLTGQTPQVLVGAEQRNFSADGFNRERELFAERLKGCEPRWQHKLIEAYANPVVAKLKPAHAG